MLRQKITYSERQEQCMRCDINSVLCNIESMELKSDTPIIFPNQLETAKQIYNNFQDRTVVNQYVAGKCQSGKTGLIIAVIKLFLENYQIQPNNIYLLSSLSSVEWNRQNKDRMPIFIKDNVFHRNELKNKFADAVRNKQNVLIILDELHIASQEEQLLSKLFEELHLLNKDYLLENDVKLIEISATPDSTIYDLKQWNEHHRIIKFEPSDNYIGAKELMNNHQIKEFKPLCFDKKANEQVKDEVYNNIFEFLSTVRKYNNPKYHIIRTHTGEKSNETINNIEYVLKKNNFTDYEIIKHDLNVGNNIKWLYIFLYL